MGVTDVDHLSHQAGFMQPMGVAAVSVSTQSQRCGPQSLFSDKRRAERLALACPIAYRIDTPRQPLEGSTKTVDLSSAGVQIVISDMVSPQTACQLTITLPEHPEPLTFRGRVTWCRIGKGKNSRTYETGIEFSKPSTYADPTFALLCRFIATRLIRKNLGS